MEQLTQNLKDGAMQLLEVPYPALSSGYVLVRNHFSLISAGTEGKTVKDARLGYIGKARARKEEVKKVLQTARTLGVMNTYRLVMNKLDAPNAMGYSCAGEVIAIADDVKDFKVGDLVACGGATANHAEVVAVPVNLCVKVNANVAMQEAAFTTVGAIAMQGIRQADLRLGENCVVIGLGLVGQLTIQLLKASGVKTIGIDIDPRQVALAKICGADLALERDREDLEQAVQHFTNGFGTDAVIITAATSSTDPVDLAGALCRKKGKVIIVGAVPTGFARKNYYNKELDLRMSSSYGPGRYDLEYEEKGLDYPQAYVRWTENRNMQAFVDLLADRKISIEYLLTHTFHFNEAPKAYQLILDKSESFSGIVLQYDLNKKLSSKVELRKTNPVASDTVSVGMIGAGSFAQNFLLPALKDKIHFTGVATARANNARNMADKYSFAYATGEASEILADKNINTVFIATRHHSHAEYVLGALQNNKNVFVEKPLCMNEDELESIREVYVKNNARLMVGFNRRFAPFIQKIKNTFNTNQPLAINYRINAGVIPAEHWVHDATIGGGRILGEVCHFIDLCMFISGSKIISVSANAMDDTQHLNDTLIINLRFENGSIASISYFSNGNKNLEKETLEVFSNGVVAIVNDFQTLQIFGKNKSEQKATIDKGHTQEVAAFVDAIKNGKPSPIPFDELYLTTLVTFKVIESIALGGKEISITI